MSQYAIVTDLNRCTGCLSCTVACKLNNDVPVGNFWIRTLRVGPTPKEDGSGDFPDVDMYYLPMQCQHCATPECVTVCPTGASQKMDDGTVQIDKEVCIGCQACIPACPYGVRYLNEDLNVVEKCTMCSQLIAEGGLPACVETCGGRARFFGDLDEGIESFKGPWRPEQAGTYDEQEKVRVLIGDAIEPYEEDDMYHFPDQGNGPQNVYILRHHYGDRRDREWQGV
jgi:Fe-S-cluster-containing dehydrogenase component